MLGALWLLVAGLSAGIQDQASPGSQSPDPTLTHTFRVETIADGLINPWSLAFLPNGDVLVTERPGRLRIIRKGVLDPRPISGVPAVLARTQGGLLDVALHPDFATNRLLYLSFTTRTADGSATTEAIVRGRFDGSTFADVTGIFQAKMLPSRSVIAMAGRLAFDHEGYLYLTLGDRAMPTDGDLTTHVAQDLSNHMGKTVRLHDDGRVPADNPFVGRAGSLPEIWSYGHRNAQGMAFHPTTGDLWQSESSAQGGDELNVIRRGANYGWPVIGFSREYGGAVLHEATAREGMEQPVHQWTPAIVPSGLMIYTGRRFPNWRDNIFVAGLGGLQLSRVIVNGRRFVAEEVLLKNALGRLRDVRQGPDGYIYVAIDGGVQGQPTAVVRLVPAPSTITDRAGRRHRW
jgi:glucose/arabinose dehydrogenase